MYLTRKTIREKRQRINKVKKMDNGLSAYFSHGGDCYDRTFQNVNLIKMPDSVSRTGSRPAEQLVTQRILYFPRKENTTIKLNKGICSSAGTDRLCADTAAQDTA